MFITFEGHIFKLLRALKDKRSYVKIEYQFIYASSRSKTKRRRFGTGKPFLKEISLQKYQC